MTGEFIWEWSKLKDTDNKKKEVSQMEMEVKTVINIPEGRHDGVVTSVENRTTPFEYTDVNIAIDGNKENMIKHGAPTSISVDEEGKPRSKLAKLMIALGIDLSKGKIDTNEMVGKNVSFVTVNKETDKGTFARVVGDSVKLAARAKK